MGIRRSCLALALLLLPAPAWAHEHNWETAATVSAASGSQLWGGNFMVGRTIYEDPKRTHHWLLLGDFGLNGGPHDGGSVRQISGLFGGRFTYWLTMKNLAKSGTTLPKLQFFLQALGGGVRVENELLTVTTSGIESIDEADTNVALSVGTGLDFLFSQCGGLRGQVDLVRRLDAEAPRKHFFRFSVGVVYRFEHD